tara:strand:+ start:18973 stop:19710 length:738 start_codon:yes stop_codon:yes gene_type:complete
MQSYLGDYPGARSNPNQKFIRAVNSVINQTDPNWELIIVSDGCKITEEIYNERFSRYKNIKFKMVEKPKETTMYTGDTPYYRGKPRAEGVKMAEGDWISYLDADDFYKKDAVANIRFAINKNKGKKYLFNVIIVENVFQMAVVKRMHEVHPGRKGNYLIKSDYYEIDGLDSYWFDQGFTTPPTGTAFIIHKNGWPKHNWGDAEGAVSEDMVFVQKILEDKEEVKYVAPVAIAHYVRCHYAGRWDY